MATISLPLQWMSLAPPVDGQQYQVRCKPRQQQPPNLVLPVVSFVSLHRSRVPDLGFIHDDRPERYRMHRLREGTRYPIDPKFDPSSEEAHQTLRRHRGNYPAMSTRTSITLLAAVAGFRHLPTTAARFSGSMECLWTACPLVSNVSGVTGALTANVPRVTGGPCGPISPFGP